MKTISYVLLGLLLAGLPSLRADVVQTSNGARIVGKITKVDGGKIYITTDYAGDLTISQSAVTGMTTDGPVVVRLASGTTLAGTVSTDQGNLEITGQDGRLTTKMDKVAATWAPGQKDPQIVAMEKEAAAQQRHWAYEATADITGKTGNSEQLGTAVGAKAVLKTPQDTLQFYTAYNRQESDGQKSADQFKAGVDYANNFSGRQSWYVRDEGGFDRIKDIELYNIAAAGVGHDFIKEADHLLTGRAGFSYRYEGYKNPLVANVSSAGLDLELHHEWKFATSKLVNDLVYVPSFSDFSNYTLTHQSYFEIPLANPAWKLRLGLSNDYNSKPGPGIKGLDTSYFTRLVLDWGQ